jgi:acetyl coenzyme A synthetase (ADP forming)-like protein
MNHDSAAVRRVIDRARQDGRSALSPDEAKAVCRAFGIATPREELVKSARDGALAGSRIGFPVVMKIASADILHKTEAGGVIANVTDGAAAERAYETLVANAKRYRADARIDGVVVQQMVSGGHEVIVGASSDATFGKVVAFGLGGILVEVLKDVTFRMAPVTTSEARAMVDAIGAAKVLDGVRGLPAADKDAVAGVIERVSILVDRFPEIAEVDLNPVFAMAQGAIAADVRILLDFAPQTARFRPSREEILGAMNRIMRPKSVAVIGASTEDGKIGNSVMRNIIDGGFKGAIYPIHPKAAEVLGRKAYRSVKEVPGALDLAVFTIPARAVGAALEECGDKGVAGAVLIPSGFAETGNREMQDQIVEIGRRRKVRLMGPNIYGFYYLPENLCATFCTPYDVKGNVALSSQSGGVGMAIIGFSRSAKMGVSAIVGLGNKADIDEDDLLTFFEEDPNTQCIAMHVEDLKDGRAFAEVARRVSRKKPVIVLKAGRTEQGARAARSHTAALAGNDRIYEDVLRQCGVVRARSLNDMLEFTRALPALPTPKGENVVIVTGAGGSGVLLADACVDNGLKLMAMPADLDAAFRKFIPPFGAAGNPVDITGGEPPSTYEKTIRLGLEEPRIHALILGYWHTIITPPMVFARLVAEVVEECRKKGTHKPVVASLVGDVEVEAAAEYLFARGIPAYAYTTEMPVAVLGAKYQWARAAGLVASD